MLFSLFFYFLLTPKTTFSINYTVLQKYFFCNIWNQPKLMAHHCSLCPVCSGLRATAGSPFVGLVCSCACCSSQQQPTQADLISLDESALSAEVEDNFHQFVVFFQWALMRRTKLSKASSCPSPLPAHSLLLQTAFFLSNSSAKLTDWQSLNTKTSFHNIPKIHVSNEKWHLLKA